VVNKFHQRINCSEEPKFDSCVEQILSNFYLPLDRTLDYHDPFTMRTEGLTQKINEIYHCGFYLKCVVEMTILIYFMKFEIL